MSKGYILEAKATSGGAWVVIYVDDITDLPDMDNIEAEELSRGSMAYDKNQITAVWDGTHWIKDDGTTLT